jgi:hypothetical protein
VPDDPFTTAAIRDRVLDAWAASPARFREDANAEEDYALGGYRDRVVVELAQNAADAAARAGLGGRLRLTLAGGTLTAANTGAPLDADGVESLSTLRASSKRGDAADATVGRFGVGFAAVVAVSDEPWIIGRAGAVRWSRARSQALAAAIPALAGELAARGGNVPVLRLPFPAEAGRPGEAGPEGAAIPDGFDTAVILPLRDEAAVALVERLLAETGPALLLALPALAEVTIDMGAASTTLTATRAGDLVTITTASHSPQGAADSVASSWLVVAEGGPLEAALLADRPVEERARPAWSVRWAVPVQVRPAQPVPAGAGPVQDDAKTPTRLPGQVAAVVHAPTPSDEPLGLPALLLASFPLSPDRRHVAPGPLTDFLTGRAADAYVRLLPALAPGQGLLNLVPGPVAAGEIDVRLRQAIVDRLPDLPFLPSAGGGKRVSPRDALLLDTAAPPALAPYLADVASSLISGPSRHPAYATLGIRRMPLADLADLVATLQRPASWWRGLYAALADVDAVALPELGALPVPLADGRLIRGPRGVLLPGPGLTDPAALAPLRLRIADPAAVHPLLARLGALEATPRGVLDHPATVAAVDASLDEDDPGPIADAVLRLVQAADAQPGEFPWLADLALPAEDGDWDPAGDLLLPGGELAEVVAADADFGIVATDLAQRYGERVLAAAGVLGSFGLLTARDVDFAEPEDGGELDDPSSSAADLDLDGADDWAADVRARCGWTGDDLVPPIASDVTAVRDLDLVDPARWPRALEILTSRPRLRAALVRPTRVRRSDDDAIDVPSYTAWWLRTHPVLGGRRPADLRAAGADPLLDGLYDDAAGVAGADPVLARLLADASIARVLGVRSSVADLLAEPGGPDDLLGRLADPQRPVTRQQLRILWMALAAASAPATPPAAIRAIAAGEVVVADPADVLVLDSPDLYPLVASHPLVLAPYDLALVLAELLDVPVASEEAHGQVGSVPERRAVPGLVHAVLPDAPDSYLAHDKLLVDGVTVPWRCVEGEVHAATPPGLACALAWAAGQWHSRHLLTTLLSSQDEAPRLLAEADLDPL